ncbi:MAG: hypothetical protein ACOYLF_04700 [Blastocatellia bacterium]
MGNRRIIRILIRSSVLALLALGLMAGTVTAQKRSSRARKTTKPAPTPDMRLQAGEVAEQIRLLSRFIFVYGKVVNGLEVAREQAARNQTSPAIETRNRQTRDGLVASIERLAAGISTLTDSFRSDPGLQIQYLRIAAARDAVSEAAGLAGQQQFDEAGAALVSAVNHLTETILSMKLN